MQRTLPVAWVWMGRSCSSIAKLHFHSGTGILWKHSYNEPCQLDQPYRERKNPLPDLFFGLWKWKKCTKEKEHYLYQQLDMDSFVTNTWSVISQKNRKLSIHYSASSECFHYTLEASPLYSLNNHPSSSTHSCNSKSHAKYGEETFQSKQAHRIVHRHFLPTNGVPIFYCIHLNCLYIHCVQNVDLWNSNPVLILLWEASLLNLTMYAVMGDARQTLKLIGSTILRPIFSVVWRCNATL